MSRILLNTYRIGKESCPYCVGHNNCIAHILFNCEGTSIERRRLWKNVTDVCPEQMRVEMESMPVKARVKFVLNALNSKFIIEWFEVYKEILYFVCILFSKYKEGLQ